MTARTLLVTGGSGRLARGIIEHLLDRGEDRIVTTTRSPEQAADLAARGVEVRALDFDEDETTIARALEGADRMLLVSTHAVGRRPEQHGKVVRAAAAAGVGHLLYTSATSPAPTPLSPIVSDHFWTELAIFGGGMPWTILRHNMYAEHLLLFLPAALEACELRTSLGDAARAYVTRADCAAADAAALASRWTDHRIYDIGGPEALSIDDVLSIAEELTGRAVAHVRTTDEKALAAYIASGLPAGFPESALGFDVWARGGHHAIVTSAVRDLTGQEPEAARSYLTRKLDVLRTGRATVAE
ncbi:NAD(P)H-binding protein [Microbacterium sp. 18062]|uniref:NAD(P)H-binding protein n=1 Tax=Microbacterium sp. 18062 TaxID=2681410 RepID=UPI00135C986B|nr:NAD(P)H-binding protein [Microbacterium sp. 18062]